jgi:catechol 2,3-dioxygenase-like lactoylglutathione lyase family enzyme
VRGLFETHVDVTDLNRSLEFYTGVLGLTLALQREVDGARVDAHSRGARRFALLWVGGRGHALLGLWERPRDHIRTQHFAFEVELHELPALVSRLEEQGIEFRDFFQQRTTTPTVFGFIPAASIYFDDPDGHVLELLAPIAGAPRPDLTAVSWAEWTRAMAGAT